MSRSPRSNVRRLALGRLLSVTGGAAAFTALNFTVWDRTHSPFMQALSLLLTFGVAGLIGPFAGALGDRLDRRMVLIWSEAISCVFFTAMVFVHSPIALILLAFASAIAELPFLSASRAAIPNLVDDPGDISWANSLVTLGVHAGIAIGPVIGGLLLALTDVSWVFGVNAISFVISLLLTISVRGRFQEERGAEHEEHAGMTAGIVYLWREPVLRRLSIAWFVFVVGMGMGMVADAPLAESFGWGPMGYGLLIACWGLGSTVGAGVGRWMTARTEPVWMVFGAFGIALAAFGVGFAPVFLFVLGALLAMGICDGLTIVSENGMLQRRTPDAVRSRAMAAFEAVLSFGLAVAYVAAAPVMTVIEPQSVYRLGGAGAALAALILVPLLRLRHEPDQGSAPDLEAEAEIADAMMYPPAS
ncbi:MAG TPA: MFS transporter [Actinomycetota bacterium]|nr:MFS transporter [Actinomycetota bacterium]